MQCMLSVYQPDADPPPPEVLGPIMAELATWRAALKEAGARVPTSVQDALATAAVPRHQG